MAAPIESTRKTLSAKNENSTKTLIKEVKIKVQEFSNNKKNANNLIDVISVLQNDDAAVVLACVRSLHGLFTKFITNQDMYLAKPQTDSQQEDLSNADKYKLWLRERYNDIKERLLELMQHQNNNVQELCLCTLMKFVEAEGNTPLREITGNHLFFPVNTFEPIILSLLSSIRDTTSLISRLQEYLEYDDVRYYTMKAALKVIKENTSEDESDIYLVNMFSMLENLTMPTTPPVDGQVLVNFLSKAPENTEKLKITSYKDHKKLYTTLWLEYLKRKLPASVYKKALLNLHDKVMPHFTSPLLLSDFLTESYNIGGAISLLALNGLFILVNTYNLNYPDFFEKLYALFEPSVFHVKYMPRFFYLADLFLTSTHLPAYLVAAFAKRLSRLSLTAPPHCQLIILPFIHNLLTRHNSCQVLIHRPAVQGLETDPYDMEERDLAKCKAMESSLWEIKTLQSHYHHTVAIEARKFDRQLNDREIDLGPLLENNPSQMFDKETKKKMKEEVPLTFTPADSLFAAKDDIMAELWTLS